MFPGRLKPVSGAEAMKPKIRFIGNPRQGIGAVKVGKDEYRVCINEGHVCITRGASCCSLASIRRAPGSWLDAEKAAFVRVLESGALHDPFTKQMNTPVNKRPGVMSCSTSHVVDCIYFKRVKDKP